VCTKLFTQKIATVAGPTTYNHTGPALKVTTLRGTGRAAATDARPGNPERPSPTRPSRDTPRRPDTTPPTNPSSLAAQPPKSTSDHLKLDRIDRRRFPSVPPRYLV